MTKMKSSSGINKNPRPQKDQTTADPREREKETETQIPNMNLLHHPNRKTEQRPPHIQWRAGGKGREPSMNISSARAQERVGEGGNKGQRCEGDERSLRFADASDHKWTRGACSADQFPEKQNENGIKWKWGLKKQSFGMWQQGTLFYAEDRGCTSTEGEREGERKLERGNKICKNKIQRERERWEK